MIGKKIRLSKIINPVTGNTCIVPMDHGITLGPIEGLVNTIDTIKVIAKSEVDAIVLHKGLLMQLTDYPEVTNSCNFIMHVSASTSFSKDINNKSIVTSVEQAVKMGAIGVSIHINLGTENESDMLKDFGKVSDACFEWGMPLLAMMYINNGKNYLSTENCAHSVKIAEELGADIVKIPAPRETSDMKDIVKCVNIPVVIAGGNKTNSLDLLKQIDEVMHYGASGIAVGRNIFQDEHPFEIANMIYSMVHKGVRYRSIKKTIESGGEVNEKRGNL